VHGWLARRSNDLIVVEFAQMVSGPMCGKMFADLGAEVIKVEPPGAGDAMRADRGPDPVILARG
jgi:crotonobetainyl-CoA:carnitine CoA-transferase CaiB-like acyl-CoA transferase